MKKIIFLSALFFFAITPHVLAAGFTALAPIPGLTDTSNTAVVNSASLATFFNNLYKYLVGLAAILAVIEIIWGGIEISTKDSVSKKSDGKARITQAILGLILVLSPVLVFSIINPSILNLSLNLPKLDTTTGTANSTGAAQTPIASSTTSHAGYTLSSNIWQCTSNNDCTSAYASAQQQCGKNATLFCATSVNGKLSVDNSNALSDTLPQNCPSGQPLVAACVDFTF